MIRLSRFPIATSFAVLLAAPIAASAQTRTTFSAAGGVSLATGPFGDRNAAGYFVSLGLGTSQQTSPLAFRAEGMVNQFNPKFAGDHASATAITGNAIYEFSPGPGVSFVPYAIGGIGFYSTREHNPFFGIERQSSNIGWNIGGGARIPLNGVSTYIEARYHLVSNGDVQFAPVVFGVTF